MPGYRVSCHYCKTSVLSRDLGRHLLKSHSDELFTEDNLRNLHRDKYFSRPLELSLDTTTYFFCLADQSCIRHEETALKHFRGKTEKHKETILSLRETYPSSGTPQVQSTFTTAEKKLLQDFIADFYHLCPDGGISKKVQNIFTKIGVTAEEKEVKALYPHVFAVKTESPPLVEEEDELLPLVYEKPMTIKEVIKETITEKVLEDLSTKHNGEKINVPELDMYRNIIGQKVPEKPHLPQPQPQPQPVKPTIPIHAKRKPKATEDQVSVPQVSVPPIQPPPEEKKDPIKEAEKQMAEMDAFKNKSPWQRFVQNNPNLSVQEQVQLAASMGIRPDAQNSRIVSNTKAAKPVRQN